MATLKTRGPARIVGSDPLLHQMYIAFGYHRVTSRLRGEAWLLTWEQWRDVWLPHWQNRGRARDQVCMARQDFEGAWDPANIEIITRSELGRRIREHYK